MKKYFLPLGVLGIFMRMMKEIGERVLCGKRWNSVLLCCKRFEGSAAVDGTGLESTACRSIFPRPCKPERWHPAFCYFSQSMIYSDSFNKLKFGRLNYVE